MNDILLSNGKNDSRIASANGKIRLLHDKLIVYDFKVKMIGIYACTSQRRTHASSCSRSCSCRQANLQ